MPSKTTPPAAAPAVKVPKPPRRNTLGEPPQSAADTASVGNNTKVAADDKLVDVGFKLPQAYRRNFRLFCASNDIAQVDAFREAMADYMKKKGWEPSN
jgi:predicted phage gp36 major capsid-like protein